ncbi:polyamine transporter [Burkholderia phage BcepSauron]|uniref:Polyamine transporter n=1 Tax=Burkholderia phage BcepSauron TaxID=2530033 RepID=A0A482MMF2_9CAUD|nr:polyamine transporter [Burkholderia phage BcepSauron]QBQ74706.1 polyamine transporter [Burkholderia phage BcepSauron]
MSYQLSMDDVLGLGHGMHHMETRRGMMTKAEPEPAAPAPPRPKRVNKVFRDRTIRISAVDMDKLAWTYAEYLESDCPDAEKDAALDIAHLMLKVLDQITDIRKHPKYVETSDDYAEAEAQAERERAERRARRAKRGQNTQEK